MNAVITGASRGIGKAVAYQYGLHGYDLFLTSKNEHNLLKTIDELKTKFPNIRIEGQAVDISDKKQARVFAQWVLHNTDQVDVLVNNAGSFLPGNISEEKDGTLETMMEVNLYSAYHVTRALLSRMMAARAGHIFTICSIASLGAYPNGGSYSISKFALLGFTKNLRRELQPFGIKVTAVIPGAVYTDSWKGAVSQERIMQDKDIASMIFSATRLSPQAVVEEIVLRPQLGDL